MTQIQFRCEFILSNGTKVVEVNLITNKINSIVNNQNKDDFFKYVGYEEVLKVLVVFFS